MLFSRGRDNKEHAANERLWPVKRQWIAICEDEGRDCQSCISCGLAYGWSNGDYRFQCSVICNVPRVDSSLSLLLAPSRNRRRLLGLRRVPLQQVADGFSLSCSALGEGDLGSGNGTGNQCVT